MTKPEITKVCAENGFPTPPPYTEAYFVRIPKANGRTADFFVERRGGRLSNWIAFHSDEEKSPKPWCQVSRENYIPVPKRSEAIAALAARVAYYESQKGA